MRKKSTAIIAGCLVATLVLAGTAFSRTTSTPTLKGVVGPGFTISLKKTTGVKVTTLAPGNYVFSITDKSSIHNYVLEGPGGLNKELAGVGFTGSKTSKPITLKAGKYTYLCTVHGFKGTFTVK